MKPKCSFILKASTALVLAVLMLFGTVATTLAATVDTADTGAQADLAETGGYNWYGNIYFRAPDGWDLSARQYVYLVFQENSNSTTAGSNCWKTYYRLTSIAGDTSNSRLYGCYIGQDHGSYQKEYLGFVATNSSTAPASNSNSISSQFTNYTALIDYGFSNNNGAYYFGPSSSAGNTNTKDNAIAGSYNADRATVIKAGNQTANSRINGANSNSTTGGTVKVSGYYPHASNYYGSDAIVAGDSGTASSSGQYNVVQGTKVTMTATTKTNYEFLGWYSGNSSTSTKYSSNTTYTYYAYGTKTAYALFRLKPTVTVSASPAAGGTVTIAGSTVSNGSSAYVSTSTNTAVTITAAEGYTISSVSGAGWSRTANETSTTSYTGTVNTASNATLTVSYSEILNSSIALTAYTDGEASTDGGTIQVNSADVTSIPVGNVGVSTGVTAVSVVSGDDYAFTGWEFDGSNYNHIKYSFNNSNWNTPAAKNTIYGADQTTIYIKTDGTSGLTTADAIVKAMFVLKNRTVTTSALLATDGTGYSNTLGDLSPTLNGAGTYVTTPTPDSVTLTATEPAGYKFVGWYVSSNGSLTSAPLNTAVQGTSGIYSYTAGTRALSFTMNTTCDLHYYALYKKIYYVTAYNSYTEPTLNEFVFRISPPRTITATNAQGTTTYNYGTTSTITARGEDNYGNGSGTGPNANTGATKNIVNTNNATYYEGNLVQVLAGDTVVLNYSTLSSSDVISGVFFNNAIRYTTELEYDNLYTDRIYQGYSEVEGEGSDDNWNYTYKADTTLFADALYYADMHCWLDEDTYESGATGALITGVIADEEDGYKATVNQDNHTVTFVADQDYLNIDLELGEKRRVFFSNTDDINIHSVHIDDFYSIGETLSNGAGGTVLDNLLYVKAAGNTDKINKISYTGIQVYRADAKGNKIGDPLTMTNGVITHSTGSFNVATNATSNIISSTAAGADSTYFIYFYGKMPEYNLYVDFNLTSEVSVYIGSQIVADAAESKTYLAQVATVTGTYTSPSSTSHTAPNNALYNSTAKTATTGVNVKFEVAFTDSWSTYYMFLGWYAGDSTGPDFTKEPLSEDLTLYYKPTKNIYIYAVGTRDVFINGSKYITGKDSNWYSTNQRMEFDPDFVNTDGGARGRYYWTIDDTMFTAASNSYYNGPNNSDTSYITYDQWNTYQSNANSYFQFFDTASNDNNQSIWSSIAAFTNGDVSSHGLDYGKTCPQSNDSNVTWERKNGYGWIAMDTSNARYNGWSSPITIYFYPGKGFSVQATPIWPHIYVSNGYKNIDQATPSNVSISVNGTASGNNGSASNSTQGKAYYQGSGWTPSCEGTVRDIQIKEKDATVKLTKTVANSNYIVSYFFCYNISKDSVSAYPAKSEGSNTYSAEIKMNDDESLYIVPIVERADADMTVLFDASQMNYSQWGKFVSCYAWYSDGTSYAYGAYPGQLMVPYDGGTTWKCNFPSVKPGTNNVKLVGITFANYLDGSNTWLGQSGILGDADGTLENGEIIDTYNNVGDGDYNKKNCKTQTYDYREPISFYTNSDADENVLTFAVKKGNANLITWTYGDLTTENMKAHAKGGSLYGTYPVNFEYLVDQKGRYVDFNGVSLAEKPAASFYVCAKGMVSYDNNVMLRQFWSGNYYEKQNGCVPAAQNKPGWTSTITYDDAYGATSGVAMNYAVEWYVYDASGNYITNVLSAGYADKSNDDITNNGKTISTARTQIAKRLDDMGYATSGRSVAICYDQPRYCYSTGGSPSVANGGSTFDAYRFAGQWVQQNMFDTATVSVKVGLSTGGTIELADSSSADFGSATVSVDKSLLDHNTVLDENDNNLIGAELKDGIWNGTVTITDGDKGGVTLTADSTNFKGWYFYNSDGELEKVDQDTISPVYKPGVSKDITYYAVFEAKATYKLNYTGRQGGAKSYSTSGGYLTSAEINNSNTVSTSRDDFNASFGSNIISVFKKTVNLSSHSALDNSTARVLQATLDAFTPETFTLTYYYPNTSGGSSVAHSMTGVTYNTLAYLPADVTAAVKANAPSGQRFVGWADYSNNTQGKILSAYVPFGYRMVKNQTIIAVYGSDAYSDDSSGWTVNIDDNQITKEMYSSNTGTYYNDTIIRVRNGADLTGENMLIPDGAEAGILLVKQGSDTSFDTSTRTVAQLTTYATNAKLTNGKTAKITSGGATVTKMCAQKGGLTMYNRADFAVSAGYGAANGQSYTVYAYLKLENGTCYFSDGTNSIVKRSGTYN